MQMLLICMDLSVALLLNSMIFSRRKESINIYNIRSKLNLALLPLIISLIIFPHIFETLLA